MEHAIDSVPHVRLLGPFEAVTLRGRIRSFGTRKASMLLAYLARQREPVARSQLAFLLWGEKPESVGRRNLSREVSMISALMPGAFIGDYDTLRLAPHILDQSDTALFETLACSLSLGLTHASTRRQRDPAALDTAVALYRGDFMSDLAVHGCPEYETWLFREREYWQRRVGDVLEYLMVFYAERHEDQRAELYIRRWLELEPWQEEAHRTLMRVLARTGRRSQALTQYDLCRRVLAQELDVEPDGATVALAGQIRAGTIDALPTSSHEYSPALVLRAKPAIHGTLPRVARLFGRSAELAAVTRWMTDERCQVIGITGLGGVGKSSLAAQLVAQEAHHYEHIIWTSLLNAPPLDELFSTWLTALAPDERAALSNHRDTQFDRLIRLLWDSRCLLVLDNFESVMQIGRRAGRYRTGYEDYGQLLACLAQRQHTSCVVLTSRELPLEMDRLGDSDSSVRVLQLTGLDCKAGTALMAHCGLDTTTVRNRLVECYSGNPLALKLVAATIRNLFAGNIQEFLSEETPLFDDIRDVLDEQFSRLSAFEHEVLVWLAIEREPVSLMTLHADLVRREPMHVMVEALRSLQRRSLLECSGDTFTLQHVVMEYTTHRLITHIVREIETGRFDMFARHALLKAQSHEYVRQAQHRLILMPIVKGLLARLGNDGAATCLRALPELFRARPELGQSYAAGNLLNMLIAMQADVRGLNLEHLAVRQVFARGVLLPQVRMANADLSGSVFTDAFHSIHAVAWSPDGIRVATGASDGSVFIWRAADGVLLESYPMSNGFIWTLDWSRDGEFLACAGSDADITVWSTRRNVCVQTLSGHGAWVNEVAFSPDSACLATCGGDHTICVWDVATGSLIRSLEGHNGIVECLAWSPDGVHLASGAFDRTIRVWDVSAGHLLYTLAEQLSRPSCLSWSSDSCWLAATGLNQPVVLWSAASGASALLEGRSSAGELVWHPHGMQLAVAGSDQTLRILDVPGQRALVAIPHDEIAGNLAWNPNGTSLAVPYANSTVHIWDSRSGRDMTALTGYTTWIYSVSWSPDSALIAAATHAHQIQIWDVASRRLYQIMLGHTGYVLSVAWKPDGTQIVSSGADGTLRLWDVESGRLASVIGTQSEVVESVSWKPDGRWIASAGRDGVVRIWSVNECRPAMVLRGHTDRILATAWHPNGHRLASGGRDRTVRIWNTDTGQECARLDGHQDVVTWVAWSPDGSRLASASNDGMVRIWNFETHAFVHVLQGHNGQIKSVVWHPSGDLLATGSNDRTIRVWNCVTGRCEDILHGHTHWIKSIAWSPDGMLIASGSYDETVRLWSSTTGECLDVLYPAGPYAGMTIGNVTGVTPAQRMTLRQLGAVDDVVKYMPPATVAALAGRAPQIKTST